MTQPSISYKRHRFPPEIIAHAVWLYVRFNLSLREVEEMVLERGIDVSHETIRRWTRKFGSLIARNLCRRQDRPGDVWHLDEVMVKIAGRSFWLWRAVDQDGVVLDEILQPRRDKRAAKRLLVTLMKRWGFVPRRIITDKLRSYGAAKRDVAPALITGPPKGSTTAPLDQAASRIFQHSSQCAAAASVVFTPCPRAGADDQDLSEEPGPRKSLQRQRIDHCLSIAGLNRPRSLLATA